MRKLLLGLLTIAVLTVFSANAWADYVFSTDRFGYTGTVKRYDTESDARNGVNVQETVNIGNRDASIYITRDTGNDMNIVMGSWWYTTDSSGSAGWGNTRGNTGIGFMQIYDNDASTDTSTSMGFQNLQGGYWTEYYLNMSGSYATAADDYARFSVYNNTNDAGTYLDYQLSLVASGFQGSQSGSDIVATNHPTGVTGTFQAIFQFGGDGNGYPADWDLTDFYSIDLAFDMTNWAFENRDSLTGEYSFASSEFVAPASAVPVPAAVWLLGSGLLGLLGIRRKNRK